MAENKLNRITRPNGDLLRVRGDLKYIQGTGTAAKTSTPYRFAKWEASDPNIDQLFSGLMIAYKIPVAGNGTYGTCLQINDTGYHPVVSNVTTKISTRYSVNAVILLVYVADIAQSVYGTVDGSTATDAANITGCWFVVNDYDSGNTKTTAGAADTSDKIFIVGSKSQASNATTYTHDTAYVDTDGHLYSNSQRVVNWGEVDDSTDGLSRSSTDIAVPTSKAVVNYIDNQGFLTSYTETDPTVPSWAKESSKPSYTYSEVGAAASNHAHGNITNGGDITATAPTIANGDQIIINDNSASKITNGPTFDGSTTTKALTPKGTWETFLQSYTETDPTVPSWAKAASKPTYTASEVGALPATTTIPSKTSQLTNDSGFITTGDIPEGAAASTTTPKMDGTAAIGTELRFARGDHVHPTDTSRAAASHSHGNITSGGDITATAPTIANGDQIVINDNSASKITNGPTFDGSTTTTALTPKGTWEAFAKASDIPSVTSTYSATGTTAVNGTAVARALGTLDSSITATSNQAISAITITDGKIASSSKITIPSGAAASKGVDTSISSGSTSTNLPTTAAVVNFIENQNYVEVTDINNLYYRGQNPITSTANDTRANWTTLGAGLWYYNQADCLIDQPYQWGYILNFVGAGVELVQFFFRQGSDQVYMRSANGTGWMTSWHQIIPAATDSFTFDSETGVLTVTIPSA